MTLRNMREHGVRAVDAMCEQCHHEAVINVDSLLDGRKTQLAVLGPMRGCDLESAQGCWADP